MHVVGQLGGLFGLTKRELPMLDQRTWSSSQTLCCRDSGFRVTASPSIVKGCFGKTRPCPWQMDARALGCHLQRSAMVVYFSISSSATIRQKTMLSGQFLYTKSFIPKCFSATEYVRIYHQVCLVLWGWFLCFIA